MASRFYAPVRLLASARWGLATGLALVGLGCALYFLLPPEPRWRLAGVGDIQEAFAEHGLFVTAGDNGFHLRDGQTGTPIHHFFAKTGPFHLYAFLPGQDLAVGVDNEGVLRRASLVDRTERSLRFSKGEWPEWLGVSPDGTFVAVCLYFLEGGEERHRLALVELATEKEIMDVPGRHDMHFSRDGGLLFVKSSEEPRSTKVWDIKKAAWSVEVSDRGRGRLEGAVSPDGRTFVVEHFEQQGDELKRSGWAIWDLRTGARTVVCEAAKKSRSQPCYSPDGRRLVFSYRDNLDWDYVWHVKVWDIETGRFLLTASDKYVPQAETVFSPDGKWLAVQHVPGGDDPPVVLRLFDVAAGTLVWQQQDLAQMFLPEPTPAFGPDGQSVVTYRGYREPFRVDIRDVKTGALLASRPIGWPYSAVVTLTPERRIHLIGTQGELQVPWWHAWLPEFMRPVLDHEPVYELAVLDVDAMTLHHHPVPDSTTTFKALSPTSFLSIHSDAATGRTKFIECWDLRRHGPWRWVIGIPVGLGVLLALVAAFRRRRAVLRDLALQVPELVATSSDNQGLKPTPPAVE